MYGTGKESNAKFLSNNIVNIDSLTVAEKNNEESQSKIFTLINKDLKSNLFVSISSQHCRSKVSINNTVQNDEDYNHLYSLKQGSSDIKIYLINDGNLCKAKFEDEIKITIRKKFMQW